MKKMNKAIVTLSMAAMIASSATPAFAVTPNLGLGGNVGSVMKEVKLAGSKISTSSIKCPISLDVKVADNGNLIVIAK